MTEKLYGIFPEYPANSSQKYYWCNLVLQGGGMHGAALTGFVKRLEDDGLRFIGIAGASAGAIAAMGMAGARRKITDPAGDSLLELIRNMPTSSFVDGPPEVRQMIRRMIRDERILDWRNIWPAFKSWEILKRTRGLNPGNTFEDWLRGALAGKFGLRSIDDLLVRLKEQRDTVAGRFGQFRGFPGSPDRMLKLTAAAMPVGIKFEFPQDTKLIQINTADRSPACLVRASMSIPIFFEPVRFGLRTETWRQCLDDMQRHLVHQELLKEAKDYPDLSFIDGGVFSNLPLYAFEGEPSDNRGVADNAQRVPTLVITLLHHDPDRRDRTQTPQYKKKSAAILSSVGDILGAIKAQRDRDAFISMNRPDRRDDLILASIDMSGHDWLDFFAAPEQIIEMHKKGIEAADRFVAKWKRGER